MNLLFVLQACGPSTVVIGNEEAPVRDTAAENLADSGDSGDSATADSGADDSGADDSGEPDPAPWCFPAGLAANASIHLASGVRVDSYDSRVGRYDSGAAGLEAVVASNGAGACAVTNGATVNGDVWVGGDPATAYCEEWGVAVSGSVDQLSAALTMPIPAEPAGLPASRGDVAVAWGEAAEWSADATFGAFTLAYGSSLTVTEDVTVRVESFTNGGANVFVSPGKTLNLYVGGPLSLQWGAKVNVDGEPGQFNVFVLGGGAVNVASGAEIVARVQAPDSAFTLAGTASGAIVVDTASAQWGAALHDDLASRCP